MKRQTFDNSDLRLEFENIYRQLSTLGARIAKAISASSGSSDGNGSISGGGFTPLRVLVTDAYGNAESSTITTTLLGYLTGSTTNVMDLNRYRAGSVALTAGSNAVNFSSTLGTVAYVLGFLNVYDSSGFSVGVQLTTKRVDGFDVTALENCTLEYLAIKDN